MNSPALKALIRISRTTRETTPEEAAVGARIFNDWVQGQSLEGVSSDGIIAILAACQGVRGDTRREILANCWSAKHACYVLPDGQRMEDEPRFGDYVKS